MTEYFYPKMSKYCLYCVRVCDVVHLVGIMNKYTDSKYTERTILKFLCVYFTIQSSSLSLRKKTPSRRSLKITVIY
jgi:hypothetical protein